MGHGIWIWDMDPYEPMGPMERAYILIRVSTGPTWARALHARSMRAPWALWALMGPYPIAISISHIPYPIYLFMFY